MLVRITDDLYLDPDAVVAVQQARDHNNMPSFVRVRFRDGEHIDFSGVTAKTIAEALGRPSGHPYRIDGYAPHAPTGG